MKKTDSNKIYTIDTLSFSGLLKWEDVEKLTVAVKKTGKEWNYIYTQEENKNGRLNPEEAETFLNERMLEIRKIDEVCGWFYVHTKENPDIIKIYHPRMSGGGCSLTTPPPWIIMSIDKPEDIANLDSYKPVIKQKRNLFSGLFD